MLLMSVPLHAKTYIVYLVFCFKICYLYSYDEQIWLKVIECFEASFEGDPKEREKVICNDIVLKTVRKTGEDTEAWLKLFAFYCSSWTLKSLQIGQTFWMKVVKKWKAVKKEENNREKGAESLKLPVHLRLVILGCRGVLKHFLIQGTTSGKTPLPIITKDACPSLVQNVKSLRLISLCF